MSSYTEFATIYDRLMVTIPYDEYVTMIERASQTSLASLHILDLGCGTGTLTEKLATQGAQVTGIDLSEQMIEIAKNKKGAQAHYEVCAMQDFQLEEKYDLIVCAIDALNYLTTWEEVVTTFERVYAHLKEDGTFIFDVHSLEKMAILYEESPFTYDDGEVAYIWETEEDEEPNAIISHLAFFVEQEEGIYRRFDETHRQQTYPYEHYAHALQNIGFTIEMITADWSLTPPNEESERIFFQVKK